MAFFVMQDTEQEQSNTEKFKQEQQKGDVLKIQYSEDIEN